MFKNLTGTHLVIIILIIIALLWFYNYYNRPNPIQSLQQQQYTQRMQQAQQMQQVPPQGYFPEVQNAQHPLHAQHPLRTPQIHSMEDTRTNSIQHRDTPFILYLFYSPQCIHSRNFMSAWEKIVGKLRGINNISARAIDGTKPENENLTFYYNINAYPTIILVTPHRNIEYAGDRSVDDLYQFIQKYMNDHN